MQRRSLPSPDAQSMTVRDFLNLIESISLDSLNGKLIIHVESLHIELHLSGNEPLESDPLNGQEDDSQA